MNRHAYHIALALLLAAGTVLITRPSLAQPALTPGVWKNITPAGVTMTPDNHVFCQGMALDPQNPATLYLGVCAYDVSKAGLYKSTDAGATWRKVGKLDEPIHMVVDPHNSNHLYCVDGVRGGTCGFWVSNDGGDTWTEPQGFKQIIRKPVGTNDLYSIAEDPTDFNHILVSFHSPWAGSDCGVLESKDGGKSWVAHGPPPTLKGGYGMAVFFLYDPATHQGDPNTWLFTAQEGGFFRTTDAGKTWTQCYDKQMTHGGNQLYRTRAGVLYAGGYQYPARSTDNGATWQQLKDSGLPYSWYIGICGDGNYIYTGSSGEGPFFISPENNGLKWKPYNGGKQKFHTDPFEMYYDAVNHIMYSANWEGLYALKVRPGE
jgi:hypothetical protein